MDRQYNGGYYSNPRTVPPYGAQPFVYGNESAISQQYIDEDLYRRRREAELNSMTPLGYREYDRRGEYIVPQERYREYQSEGANILPVANMEYNYGGTYYASPSSSPYPPENYEYGEARYLGGAMYPDDSYFQQGGFVNPLESGHHHHIHHGEGLLKTILPTHEERHGLSRRESHHHGHHHQSSW